MTEFIAQSQMWNPVLCIEKVIKIIACFQLLATISIKLLALTLSLSTETSNPTDHYSSHHQTNNYAPKDQQKIQTTIKTLPIANLSEKTQKKMSRFVPCRRFINTSCQG